MSNPDLTVLVLNLSPTLTLGDLNAYFSNCGHVEKIELIGANRDQTQSALVSFRQPYAYQTALLLNVRETKLLSSLHFGSSGFDVWLALGLQNAIFAGQPIRVLPKKDVAGPPVSYRTIPIVSENNKTRGNIPMFRAVADALASEGVQTLNRTRDVLEHEFKLSGKSRAVKDKTRVAVCAADQAISAAEEAARDVVNRIKNTDYVAVGATWLSGVLQKTSKLVLELGNNRKGHNPKSRDGI